MKRSKPYRRYQRRKHMKKKVNIIKNIWGQHDLYKPEGYYNKNKVHCSCDVCSGYRKTTSKFVTKFHLGKNWKKRDAAQLLREKDYYDEN